MKHTPSGFTSCLQKHLSSTESLFFLRLTFALLHMSSIFCSTTSCSKINHSFVIILIVFVLHREERFQLVLFVATISSRILLPTEAFHCYFSRGKDYSIWHLIQWSGLISIVIHSRLNHETSFPCMGASCIVTQGLI